jgi:FAD/FMN-containing dehydrogenase
LTAGGRVVKNVAGFDLTRVAIGSWGTLGVIVSASLRLRALPGAVETWIIPAASIPATACAEFVRGPYAPIAYAAITADAASAIGVPAEPHHAMRIAGNAAHVSAARSALLAGGAWAQVDDSVWSVIRRVARVPAPQAGAMDETLRLLNSRVREAFDPHGVFVSPVMERTAVLAGG